MKRKALLIVLASLLMIGCGGKPAEPSSEVKPPVSSEPAPSSEDKPTTSEAPKQDNQGRELTLQQQDFYKNVAPQLRDENGNIKTFYHGTPTGEFTVFNEGSYFSDREEYATGYQNPSASSISSGKQTTAPKTYEVYLNITNPFTLSNQTAKDIYINEYIKGGNSAYYDPYTDYTDTINRLDEIDWVEGEDLKEWLQENHPEYDGLILDEGGDGGYGEAEYRWRGLSYVPFNSNFELKLPGDASINCLLLLGSVKYTFSKQI